MIIITGTVCSRTSAMLWMLEEGGIKILYDFSSPDEKHPKGRYELKDVRTIALKYQKERVALKIFSAHLIDLLPKFEDIPKIIVMRRSPERAAASWLDLTGHTARNAENLLEATNALDTVLINYPHLNVDSDRFIDDTELVVDEVITFIGGEFDKSAMVLVPDKNLRHH